MKKSELQEELEYQKQLNVKSENRISVLRSEIATLQDRLAEPLEERLVKFEILIEELVSNIYKAQKQFTDKVKEL